MAPSRRRRRSPRPNLTILGVLAGALAALVALVGPGGSTTPSRAEERTHALDAQGHESAPPLLAQGDHVAPGGGAAPPLVAAAGLGSTDGVIPAGAVVSVFDDTALAVSRLDPDLLDALRKAAKKAATSRVTFQVNSGWRSARYQQRLLDDAIAEYGSLARASRWVATPETSAHVSGDAVDIGPSEAAAWLAAHGDAYGLCQIYRNEPWHFEFRSDAAPEGCPAMYADPTEDPRMRP